MDNTYLIGALGGLALIAFLFLGIFYVSRRHRPLGEKKSSKQEAIETGFIVDSIEDGVVMIDKANQIRLFNPGAAKITGWPVEEALGMDYQTVLPLVDDKNRPKPSLDHAFIQAMANGQSMRDSHAILATRRGKPLPISLIVSPVLGSDGQPSGSVVGVFRDITKEAQEEQARSDFISTASHEMRTPLAAIDGYLALALNPKTAKIDDNAKKLLEKATLSTKHLGELFRDLLTSSKAEDGRLLDHPEAVDIGQILEEVSDGGTIRAREKGLSLKYVISSQVGIHKSIRPLYYAYADPNRLREVFQNIVDNAIKYTMNGSIELRLTGDARVVQVQVKDSGTGIPAEDIPHLFQKFYRVDNSTTRTVGGTGLGLFICRKIIEFYNGRIWVESELGKGSTFFINLPRLNSEQALEMQQNPAAIISPQRQKV